MIKKKTILTCLLSLTLGFGGIAGLVIPRLIEETDSVPEFEYHGGIVASAEDDEDDGLVLKTVPYAVSAEYGSVTVNATVLPETTIDKRVDWSVAWANPSSAWANGKDVNDYISLDSTDSSVTAICLAPFGEQIILTATLKADDTLSDSMTLDFYRRVERITLNLDAGDGKTSTLQSGAGVQTWNWNIKQSSYPGYGSYALVNALQGACSITLHYGVGTKNDIYASHTISYRHSQGYVQDTPFGNKFSKNWISSGSNIGLQNLFETGGLYVNKTYPGINSIECIDLDFLKELQTTFNSTPIDYDFKIDLTMTSGKTYSYTIPVDVNTNLGVANSIVLDKDSYIF